MTAALLALVGKDLGSSAEVELPRASASQPAADSGRIPFVIRGVVCCEPAGSLDLQGLCVKVEGKRGERMCPIDGQARFEVDNLRYGTYCVSVWQDMVLNQVLGPGHQVRFDGSQAEYDVILAIGKPVQVMLVVLEQGSRRPVEGLSVGVRAVGGPCGTSLISDAEGRCEFRLAPGQYSVEATSWADHEAVRVTPQQITVAGDKGPTRVELSVPAHAAEAADAPQRSTDTLECDLVDSAGVSVAGFVRISGLYQVDDSEPNTRFVIPIQPNRGSTEWSLGQAREGLGARARRFLYRDSGSSHVKIVLEPMARVTGRVVDPNGQAIRDAHVDLETLLSYGIFQTDGRSSYRASVGDDGRFVFADVPVGPPVRVTADATGRPVGQSCTVELKAGQTTDVGEISLAAKAAEDAVLSGRVTDENGWPVPGCEVTAAFGTGAGSLRTSDKGRFAMRSLPRGKDVTLTIAAPRYGPLSVRQYGKWSITGQTGDESLDLQILPEGWKVLDGKAPDLVVGEWWNSRPVSLEQARGKVIVLTLGADPVADDAGPRPPYIAYAKCLMDVHRRFGEARVQVIIVYTYPAQNTYHARVVAVARRDLEDGYFEADDLSFAACVDGDPNRASRYAVQGCESLGATYTLYQARRPNTLVVIDKRGIVRAYVSAKELEGWVERLVAE
jgi:hypothetical protein